MRPEPLFLPGEQRQMRELGVANRPELFNERLTLAAETNFNQSQLPTLRYRWFIKDVFKATEGVLTNITSESMKQELIATFLDGVSTFNQTLVVPAINFQISDIVFDIQVNVTLGEIIISDVRRVPLIFQPLNSSFESAGLMPGLVRISPFEGVSQQTLFTLECVLDTSPIFSNQIENEFYLTVRLRNVEIYQQEKNIRSFYRQLYLPNLQNSTGEQAVVFEIHSLDEQIVWKCVRYIQLKSNLEQQIRDYPAMKQTHWDQVRSLSLAQILDALQALDNYVSLNFYGAAVPNSTISYNELRLSNAIYAQSWCKDGSGASLCRNSRACVTSQSRLISHSLCQCAVDSFFSYKGMFCEFQDSQIAYYLEIGSPLINKLLLAEEPITNVARLISVLQKIFALPISLIENAYNLLMTYRV